MAKLLNTHKAIWGRGPAYGVSGAGIVPGNMALKRCRIYRLGMRMTRAERILPDGQRALVARRHSEPQPFCRLLQYLGALR